MSKIRDNNYYIIHGWMLNQLNLKGTQLQIYAIIYGFSQDRESNFSGSLSYLCDFTGVSKPTVIKDLKELQEKGLITKTVNVINGIHFNTYRANFNGSKESLLGGKKPLQGSKETLPQNGCLGSKETLPNKESLDLYNESDKESNNESLNCSFGNEPKKERTKNTDKEAEELFEALWKKYPVKRGKGSVKISTKRKLLGYGYEQMVRCVDRYVSEIKRLGKEAYFKDGSTFFNSGYIDFLDENYQERPKLSGGNGNGNTPNRQPEVASQYKWL